MNIAFYAGNCIPIHQQSLEERPLGGTETALIRLAEVLHQRAHQVTVFTSMKNPPPGTNDGPRYIQSSEVKNHPPFDVFVLIQDWTPAFLGAPGKRFFFWTGDGWDQYANYGIGDARVPKRIEKLLAVSQWHADTLCERSGYPREQTHVIGNGVHLPFFEGSEKRNANRLIYTAAPYRGLALVPKIFSTLKSRHPDVELDVFAGMNIYDRESEYQGRYVEEYKRIRAALESLPDVRIHGNVPQAQLARELMKSAVFIYPNIIFETCCITAIEAQAAGCPVVASATSALPETVGEAGFLIDGMPGSAEYLESFTEAVSRLLTDNDLRSELSHRALIAAETKYSWDHVADRFENLL